MQYSLGNVIDIILALLFLIAVFRGWRIGLALKVGHLVSLIAAGIVAGVVAGAMKFGVYEQFIRPYLEERAGSEAASGMSVLGESISYYLLFGIIFAVALLVFRQLTSILKLVDKIPVIGTLNKAGGAVIGFLVQFLFLYILGRILFGIFPMQLWEERGLTKEIINQTYLLQAFVPK